MPALPWVKREPIDPAVNYIVMASRLPLASHRSVPGFLRDTLAIRRQLAAAEGMIGYGLDADLVNRTFWTFSVWKSRDALESFSRSNPHQGIIEGLRPRMGETRFEYLELAGDAIPKTWPERKALLDPTS